MRRRPYGKRAATTLEFGILCLPLVVLVLGTLEVGYDFFVAAALDNAVQTAARAVQVGTAQGAATGSAETKWAAAAICPSLRGLLNCSSLYVSIVAIPSGVGQNYYSYIKANPPSLTSISGSGNSVCTGSGGQLMLLRAYYLGPTFLGLLVPAWSQPSPVTGSLVHVSYAAAGFVNEFFSGGQSGC